MSSSDFMYYNYSYTTDATTYGEYTDQINFEASNRSTDVVSIGGFNIIPYCYFANLQNNSFDGYYNDNIVTITDIYNHIYQWSGGSGATGASLTSGTYTDSGITYSLLQMILNPTLCTTSNRFGPTIISTYSQLNVNYYVLNQGSYLFSINGGPTTSFNFGAVNFRNGTIPSQNIVYNE